jgi:hypothetical protein
MGRLQIVGKQISTHKQCVRLLTGYCTEQLFIPVSPAVEIGDKKTRSHSPGPTAGGSILSTEEYLSTFMIQVYVKSSRLRVECNLLLDQAEIFRWRG